LAKIQNIFRKYFFENLLNFPKRRSSCSYVDVIFGVFEFFDGKKSKTSID